MFQHGSFKWNIILLNITQSKQNPSTIEFLLVPSKHIIELKYFPNEIIPSKYSSGISSLSEQQMSST